jgi:hypothetical protein
MKSFNDWWKTVPEDLRSKSRNGDEANKPMLNQVNDTLLNLQLAGKHDAKPTPEELKDWLPIMIDVHKATVVTKDRIIVVCIQNVLIVIYIYEL